MSRHKHQRKAARSPHPAEAQNPKLFPDLDVGSSTEAPKTTSAEKSASGSFLRKHLKDLVLLVVSLAAGVLLTKLLESRRDLRFQVDPSRTVIADPSRASSITVQINGTVVTNTIYAAKIVVMNKGATSIKKSDFLTPSISLVPTASVDLIDVSIIRESRPECSFNLINFLGKDGKTDLDWRILEEGDGVEIQTVYSGPRDVGWKILGSIEGQKQAREVVKEPARLGGTAWMIGASSAFFLSSIGLMFTAKRKPKAADVFWILLFISGCLSLATNGMHLYHQTFNWPLVLK